MKSIIGRNVLMQFLNSFWKVRQKQVQNKLILSSVSVFVATEYFIPDEKEWILKGMILSGYLLSFWKAKMCAVSIEF